ncbi:hypothetical protein V2J09_016734 [Rumex salicifolius]
MKLDEREGGLGLLSSDSLDFIQWANNLHLIDMGHSGQTLYLGQGEQVDNRIAKRLDRVSLEIPTIEALKKLKEALLDWNIKVFRNIHRKKNKFLNKLKGVAKALDRQSSNFLLSLRHDLHAQLERVLEEEELLWF